MAVAMVRGKGAEQVDGGENSRINGARASEVRSVNVDGSFSNGKEVTGPVLVVKVKSWQRIIVGRERFVGEKSAVCI